MATIGDPDLPPRFRAGTEIKEDSGVFTGRKEVTEFIAEVCSNHNNDLSRALALIDTAAEIDCSAVKFQLFRLDKLYTPEALGHPDYRQLLAERRAWELPLEWLPALANRARQRNIQFGCTPFYLEAVDELLPYVDFFKVASYNLLHDDLLVKVARTGKPVILSTGMATIWEIEKAVKILKVFDCRVLTLLHCVSVYPAPLDSLNSALVTRLENRLEINVGWSDHTVNPAVIYCFAFGYGVNTIEFHLDLDGQGNEYKLGHCWLPGQIAAVIKTLEEIRRTEITKFSESEATERLWRADPSDGLRPMREMRERL